MFNGMLYSTAPVCHRFPAKVRITGQDVIKNIFYYISINIYYILYIIYYILYIIYYILYIIYYILYLICIEVYDSARRPKSYPSRAMYSVPNGASARAHARADRHSAMSVTRMLGQQCDGR